MPIQFRCDVFSAEDFEGKNGWGANIRLIDSGSKSIFEVYTKDKTSFGIVQAHEGESVIVTIELKSSKFGLQFGRILDVQKAVS